MCTRHTFCRRRIQFYNMLGFCGMAGATPIALSKRQGRGYLICLGVVELKVPALSHFGYFYRVILRIGEWQVPPPSHFEGIGVYLT